MFDDCDLFAYAAKQQWEPESAKRTTKARPLPAEVIRESLEIDASVPSGLRWRIRPRHHFATERGWKIFNANDAGKPAGRQQGISIYYQVGLHGVPYKTHRIIFFLANGVDPGTLHIDHIRADLPLPNVASNLRLATNAENLRNRGRQINNTSGTPGVDWFAPLQKWRARIKVNGKQIHLGYFDKYDDAVAARRAAEARYFGAFAYAASQSLARGDREPEKPLAKQRSLPTV